MNETEEEMYSDYAIKVLSHGFPNAWNHRSHQQGHSWTSWESCSAILPHVNRLMELTEVDSLKTINTDLFANLILRAGT